MGQYIADCGLGLVPVHVIEFREPPCNAWRIACNEEPPTTVGHGRIREPLPSACLPPLIGDQLFGRGLAEINLPAGFSLRGIAQLIATVPEPLQDVDMSGPERKPEHVRVPANSNGVAAVPEPLENVELLALDALYTARARPTELESRAPAFLRTTIRALLDQRGAWC
ncbi:hypothetical protein BC828DRAFT_271764 [Blastocladiella britannica]|nr:hypothetical protein BC828DRAFT_271764 [Blastocladiella britannica]